MSVILLIINCCLILGQLFRIEISPWLVFYPHDFFIACFLLGTIFRLSKKNQLKNFLELFDARLLFLFGWLGLASLTKFIFYEQSIFLLYFFRLSFYTVFLVFLNSTLPKIDPIVKKFSMTLPVFITAVSLAMYLISPDMRSLRILGWDDHFYRLIGPLLDPNFTGLVLVIGLITSLHIALFGKKNKIIYSVAMSLSAIALALTFSRSAYLSLATGLIAYAWFFIQKNLPNKRQLFLKLGFLILLVLLTIHFAPKPGGAGVDLTRTFSIAARQQHDGSWTKFNSFNLLDWLIGPAQISTDSKHAKLANNLLVTIFSWAGPIGIFFFLIWIINFFKKIKPKNFWLIAGLSACLTYAQFNNILEPFVYLIIGVTLIASKKQGLRLKN